MPGSPQTEPRPVAPGLRVGGHRVERVVGPVGGRWTLTNATAPDGRAVALMVSSTRVVDDPAERRRLHERTGADAADMESGPLARSGRLAGCLRAVSDTPAAPLGPIARLVDRNGRLQARGVVGALAHPRESARALVGVRRALRALQQTVAMSGAAR